MIFFRRGITSSGGAEWSSGCASSSRASSNKLLVDSESRCVRLSFSSILLDDLSEVESYCCAVSLAWLEAGVTALKEGGEPEIFEASIFWCPDSDEIRNTRRGRSVFRLPGTTAY